jgi:short-subunit dehydrogenase involved in D-alanine esterification of teichoic acids
LIGHDVEERLGPIDILINNAGMAAPRGLDDMTEEDFDRAIAINLKSVFLCTQAVLRGMRARRWGRIVKRRRALFLRTSAAAKRRFELAVAACAIAVEKAD